MAQTSGASGTHERSGRACGECSLCCTLLRVDALGKLGGTPCRHQRLGDPEGGCGIHARRPEICRGYRCLWLNGSLEETDRPDRLGAVLSLATQGETPTLFVHEARAGAYEASPRLQVIANEWRESLPVRIADSERVMDPDRPVRVLLPGGAEQLIEGDRVTLRRPGRPDEVRTAPLLERGLRRAVLAVRRHYLAWMARRRV
jgi:Fe-S-cluster containining protein